MARWGITAVAFLAICLPATGFAHAGKALTGGTQLWGTRFTTPSDDVASAEIFSTDGSKLFVTGSGGVGMETIAYDSSNGSTVWSRDYNYGTNAGKAIAVSSDGSKVFVTGQSKLGSQFDYVTVAYDTATGTRLWLQRFDSTAHSDDVPAALAVSPDGSKVFVTGTSTGSSTGKDYATIAYDASSGARLWVTRFNSTSNLDDAATALGVSSDGSKVFVTGASAGSTTRSDYATLAYNSSTGGRLWVRRWNSAGNGADLASALGVSPDGSKVFVTGESEEGSSSLYSPVSVAYSSSTGAQLWNTRYTNAVADTQVAPSLAMAPDGSKVYIATTGIHSHPAGQSFDYETFALDSASGSTLWSSTYDGPLSSEDIAHAVAVSPDGTKVFVTGSTLVSAANNRDYGTLAYDASTGHTLWTRLNNGAGSGFDRALAVAVSPDSSKVAVTGSSPGSGTGLDWSTIVYASG